MPLLSENILIAYKWHITMTEVNYYRAEGMLFIEWKSEKQSGLITIFHYIRTRESQKIYMHVWYAELFVNSQSTWRYNFNLAQ
jgi:hypothetical protein